MTCACLRSSDSAAMASSRRLRSVISTTLRARPTASPVSSLSGLALSSHVPGSTPPDVRAADFEVLYPLAGNEDVLQRRGGVEPELGRDPVHALPEVGQRSEPIERSERRVDVQVPQVTVQHRQADRRRLDERRRDGRAQADQVQLRLPALLHETPDVGRGPRPDRDEHEGLERDEDRQADRLVVQAGPLAHQPQPGAHGHDQHGGRNDPANDLAGRTGIGHLANQRVLGIRGDQANCQQHEGDRGRQCDLVHRFRSDEHVCTVHIAHQGHPTDRGSHPGQRLAQVNAPGATTNRKDGQGGREEPERRQDGEPAGMGRAGAGQVFDE